MISIVSKAVITEIDRIVKEVWKKDICLDYKNDNMLREDSMKSCFYYHLRRKLGSILKENNLRVYTEYWVKELRYRADIAIVELNPDSNDYYLKNRVANIVAIFELKFDGGNSMATAEAIKKDVHKIKEYIQSGKLLCQFYFAVIYETKNLDSLKWFDKRNTKNWVNGFVTELDAGGYADGEIKFEVHSYNNMNPKQADPD